MKDSNMINVTKTYLPPLKEYIKYLEKIWESGYIANHNKFTQDLEKKLKKYLGAKHLFLVSNGTIALQIAMRALSLKGEIITTPFSYVASASSIIWEHCKPVFVDIDPDTLTIDAKKIKEALTSRTKAILGVHVYGNICDIEEISRIAKKNKLKVIYDAAHAFGVSYKNQSVANFGDVSAFSFHATKIFHTVEGGALVTNDEEVAHRISYMRNFGHNGPEAFFGLGINGKISELHAAMGLAILPKVRKMINYNKKIHKLYDNYLSKTSLKKPAFSKDVIYNYLYYPVIFPFESQLLKVRNNLNKHNIYPRRYFYPSLSKLNYIQSANCPIAEDIARRILCLPLYPTLKEKEIKKITRAILEIL